MLWAGSAHRGGQADIMHTNSSADHGGHGGHILWYRTMSFSRCVSTEAVQVEGGGSLLGCPVSWSAVAFLSLCTEQALGPETPRLAMAGAVEKTGSSEDGYRYAVAEQQGLGVCRC